MFATLIASVVLIVLAGVLWLRPWVDDHYHPYE
jgi:hypothetical protein